MPAPTSFPVWLQNPGQPDVIVNDLPSYNYVLTLGWTYNSASTPVQNVAPGVTIAETSLSPGQPDPSQPVQQP